MSDELLPMVERIITRRYGQPVDHLYTQLTAPDRDPALAQVLAWHQRLIRTVAYLQRCEDALLPHLAHPDDDLTPQQHQDLTHAAHRLTLAASAREAVATTLLHLLNTPTPAASRPAPRAPRTHHTSALPPAPPPPSPPARRLP